MKDRAETQEKILKILDGPYPSDHKVNLLQVVTIELLLDIRDLLTKSVKQKKHEEL
jgi:hypothetical protein